MLKVIVTMSYERTIQVAVIKETGDIVNADNFFANTNIGHQHREAHARGEISFECYECQCDIGISTSKFGRIHFKHKPGDIECVLRERINNKELEKYNNVIASKESDRHKYLKNLIGQKILQVKGVDIDSVFIDNRYLIKENGKKRPDVYCKFNNKEIVFEIQISELSLKYILSRYDFYKTNNIYLIWILDDLNTAFQKQFEKDIKYLTEQENLFKFDEKSEEFRLECRYKKPYKENRKLKNHWKSINIKFHELRFDPANYQVYYYDYGYNYSRLQEELKIENEQLLKQQRELIIKEEKELIERDVLHVLSEIRRFRENNAHSYDEISVLIDRLTYEQLDCLNEKINKVTSSGKHPLRILLEDKNAKNYFEFFKFIFNCDKIQLDINELDNECESIFQVILYTKLYYKRDLLQWIFKRGYRLNQFDHELTLEIEEESVNGKANQILYNYASEVNSGLINDLFKNEKLVFTIESIKRNELIGTKVTNWIAFINNVILFQSHHWHYVKCALENYNDFWNRLHILDKKGSFKKSMSNIKEPFRYDCEKLIQELYPELFE